MLGILFFRVREGLSPSLSLAANLGTEGCGAGALSLGAIVMRSSRIGTTKLAYCLRVLGILDPSKLRSLGHPSRIHHEGYRVKSWRLLTLRLEAVVVGAQHAEISHIIRAAIGLASDVVNIQLRDILGHKRAALAM